MTDFKEAAKVFCSVEANKKKDLCKMAPGVKTAGVKMAGVKKDLNTPLAPGQVRG